MAQATSNDGASIHYEVFGQGDRNWIFLHGWGSNAEFWDDFIKNHFDLTNNRAICLSFRGHGLSDKPLDGYTYDQFADDVLAVAAAAGAKQFVLAGFSMGGKCAQFISAKHPGRVAGQILIASPGPEPLPFERETTLQFCRSASEPKVVHDFFRPWAELLPNEKLFDGFVESVTQTSTFVLEKTIELVAWESIASHLEGNCVSTLAVAGRDDPVYSPEYQQQRVMPFFKNAQQAVSPCGHFVSIESPDLLAKLMRDFL